MKPIPYSVSKNISVPVEDALIPDYKIYSEHTPVLDEYYSIRDVGEYTVLELYPYDYIPAENKLIVRHYSVDYNIQPAEVKAPTGNMLLIYPAAYSSFTDEIELFFAKRGKQVNAVPRDSIGYSSSEIEDYIRTKYAAEPFDFILILGTNDRVPSFIGIGEASPRTDLNYTLIDTLDYFPDLIVSRIPAQDSTELRYYLDNLYDYFSSGLQEEKNKAYFMATNDAGNHLLAEATHNYTMDILRSGGFTADSFFLYYSTGTPVSEAVNDGREMMFYSGHGSVTSWVGPSFNADSIDALENAPHFPFAFSFACLTGKFEYNDFLGRFWTMNEDKGAIGFIGSSVNTYWTEDDILQRSLADSLLNTDYTAHLMNNAKLDYYAYFGDTTADGAGTRTRAYFECYNYFTIPDLVFGNRGINDIHMISDRFEPASAGIIPFEYNYTGMQDMPSYVYLYSAAGEEDTAEIISTGQYTVNHSRPAGSDVYLSMYIPGNRMLQDTVTLIPDGPYAALSDYEVDDVILDTFVFNLNVKNYGNAVSDTVRTFIEYLSANFEEVSCTGYSDPLMSESIAVMNGGLILKLAEQITDSLSICTLGVSQGNDTTYAEISLASLNPDFDADFMYAVYDNDTTKNIIIGRRAELYFSIKNISLLKMKELEVYAGSGSVSFIDSIAYIDSLVPGDSCTVHYPAYLSSTDNSSAAIDITVSLGSMKKTYQLSVPLRLENSVLYYGPVNNYYIYTSDMVDLENAPVLYDYMQYNAGWKTQYFRNDTLLKLELPFYFRMGSIITDKVFLNSNGVLAVQPDEAGYGSPTALPSSTIGSPAFVCAWEDFIQPNNYGTTLEDQPGNILTRFDEEHFRYVILYNKVKNLFSDEFSFAIAIDTSSVEVYIYDVPDTNYLINGIQFSDAQYLALTGDSFFDSSGNAVIRDSMAIRFSDEKPVFISKFTERTENKDLKPMVMNESIMRSGDMLFIGIFSNGDYDVDLYDAAGRLVSRMHSGLIGQGTLSLPMQVKSDGVYFVNVKKDNKQVMTRKLVIFR